MAIREELLEPVLRHIRMGVVKKYLDETGVYCDIGCGSGAFLRAISPRILKGYGFDKKAKEAVIGNITIRRGRIDETIPLASNSVDCVTLLAVLEHLGRPEAVLFECHRILKTGGRIIVTTPSPMSKPVLEFLSFRLHIVSPEEIRDHKHYYSRDELKAVLERYGFTGVTTRRFELGLNSFAMGYKP